MANVFTRGTSRRVVRILLDGVTNWDCQTEVDPAGYFPGGMKPLYCQFITPAGGFVRIRDGGVASEASILEAYDLAGEGRALSLRDIPKCYPAIAAADVEPNTVVILVFI